jgi:uncharacterized membrane protein YecN with MAPEG domain
MVEGSLKAAAQTAAFWIAVHLLLLLALSILAHRQRRRRDALARDDGAEAIARSVYAFTAAGGYIPAGLVGLVGLAAAGATPLSIDIAASLLFAGRVTHAWGTSRVAGPSLLSSIGMLLTWLAYVFEGTALFLFAIA